MVLAWPEGAGHGQQLADPVAAGIGADLLRRQLGQVGSDMRPRDPLGRGLVEIDAGIDQEGQPAAITAAVLVPCVGPLAGGMGPALVEQVPATGGPLPGVAVGCRPVAKRQAAAGRIGLRAHQPRRLAGGGDSRARDRLIDRCA